MNDIIVAKDPLNGEGVELPADVGVDEIINSPITGIELEIVSLDLVALGGAPELGEDWGE